MFIAVSASGRSYGIALGGLAAILAGALIGISRRLTVERTEQRRARRSNGAAEVERGRAELLGERNRLAREIHDVLAHTLAALSLQLEAFATVVDGEPGTSPAVREQLEKTRLLVHEGAERGSSGRCAPSATMRRRSEQLERLAARFTTTEVHPAETPGDLRRSPCPVRWTTTCPVPPGACPCWPSSSSPRRRSTASLTMVAASPAARTAAPFERSRPTCNATDPDFEAKKNRVLELDEIARRPGHHRRRRDAEVVGWPPTVRGDRACAASTTPTSVLMDLRMPSLDGEAADRGHQGGARRRPTVVVLTTYADDESILAALSAGASRLPDQGRRPGRHPARARGGRRRSGGPRLQRAGAPSPAASRGRPAPWDDLPDGLTERDAEVLALIAAGPVERRDRRRLYVAEPRSRPTSTAFSPRPRAGTGPRPPSTRTSTCWPPHRASRDREREREGGRLG